MSFAAGYSPFFLGQFRGVFACWCVLSGCALYPVLGMGRSNAPVAQVGEMPILSQNSRGVHYGNEKTK